MEILDIRDNFLKEESVDEMSKLIRTCNKLHSLNVSDCNLTKDDNEKIITALEESKIKYEKLGYNYDELNEV